MGIATILEVRPGVCSCKDTLGQSETTNLRLLIQAAGDAPGHAARTICASQMSKGPLQGRDKAPVTDRKAHLSEKASDTAELTSAVVQAREIILLAFGENKTSTVAKAVEGPVSPSVPASFLQEHPNAMFYLDEASCAGSFLGHQTDPAERLYLLTQGAKHICGPLAVHLTVGREGAQSIHLECLRLPLISSSL